MLICDMCADVCGYVRMYADVSGCMMLCADVCGYVICVPMYADVPGYLRMRDSV